jgi:acetyl-CoA acetyltransferase
VALMAAALARAADDAGSRRWLERADAIAVPRGFWSYADPARGVAERVKATRARTQLAEIGVLQTTLFARACHAIASGEAEVVLVTGGERSTAPRTTSARCGQAPITISRCATRRRLAARGDILSPVELASHSACRAAVRRDRERAAPCGRTDARGCTATRSRVFGRR